MDNYRSIAVTPPFTKLLMSIMNQRLTEHARRHTLHAPIQAGFRRFHTTIDQALILQTVIQYCNKANKPMAIAFIDLEKAYDKINRAKLWDALIQELKIP
jgi:hypothetical protein